MINWDSAFGKNDIRGIYGKDVTEELFFFTSKAYIKYIMEQTGKQAKDIWVTVCMDARTHSPQLKDIIVKGVTSAGANIIDLGLAATPLGYYSEHADLKEITGENEVMGAMIVTASHNPSQYNGLKMTFDKKSMTEAQFQEIKKLAIAQSKESLLSHTFGKSVQHDIIPEYINELCTQFKSIGKGIKVVVDSANGTGGIVGPELYRRLGCNVIELYSNPDGRFPHHHPNPSDESTLDDIKKVVVENKADLGIAFDGDSDRIGVIDSKGNHLTGDKLLLIYALDVIERYRLTKTTPVVVSEVKCSQVLFDTINKSGGKAIMCKTGHGYIKAKMAETNAHLAGEMSGHIFFKDRYYGYDDAFYAGCRVIEIISKMRETNNDFDLTDMLKPFDAVYISDEVRLHCENELKKPVLEMFEKMVEDNKNMFGSKIQDIITLDGMRIVFDGGFALVRQSNTEPVFTLRFEAKKQKDCEHYQEVMIQNLNKCIENCNKN